MHRQIRNMLEWEVIKTSDAPHASPVHMVKKPNTTELRFTIDYRRLNECIEAHKWPIPNIKDTLNRVGQKKPKWFATIDFTKGYYQAPLAKESRRFTTFITPEGAYEWQRVPMGLKNAGSYFQCALATEVLRELLHDKCMLYIDDLIIFGQTEEEYLANLDAVLKRLEEHNILVHPGKCRLTYNKSNS